MSHNIFTTTHDTEMDAVTRGNLFGNLRDFANSNPPMYCNVSRCLCALLFFLGSYNYYSSLQFTDVSYISENWICLHLSVSKGFDKLFSLGLTWPGMKNKETRIVLLLLLPITSARIKLLRHLFYFFVFKPTYNT